MDFNPPSTQRDTLFRGLLICCGPMNLLGAISFSPPFTFFRNFFGLPEAPPFYLWIFSFWLLIFGIAYFRMGWTGKIDQTFLAVGVAGKMVFGLVVIALSISGDLTPIAISAGLPDIAIAIIFAIWLYKSNQASSKTPELGLVKNLSHRD